MYFKIFTPYFSRYFQNIAALSGHLPSKIARPTGNETDEFELGFVQTSETIPPPFHSKIPAFPRDTRTQKSWTELAKSNSFEKHALYKFQPKTPRQEDKFHGQLAKIKSSLPHIAYNTLKNTRGFPQYSDVQQQTYSHQWKRRKKILNLLLPPRNTPTEFTILYIDRIFVPGQSFSTGGTQG